MEQQQDPDSGTQKDLLAEAKRPREQYTWFLVSAVFFS